MEKKITVQQLYDLAHEQEILEYLQAVKKLVEVCKCYKYDEDNENEVDTHRPRIAASPKHYEGTTDFTVVAIDEDGYLDLEDEWGNVCDCEAPQRIEYGHLQYVTDFVWMVVVDRLIKDTKALMIKTDTFQVHHRRYVFTTWYDTMGLKHTDEVITDRIWYDRDVDKLVVETDGASDVGGASIAIENIEFDKRLTILENVISTLKNK